MTKMIDSSSDCFPALKKSLSSASSESDSQTSHLSQQRKLPHTAEQTAVEMLEEHAETKEYCIREISVQEQLGSIPRRLDALATEEDLAIIMTELQLLIFKNKFLKNWSVECLNCLQVFKVFYVA